MAAITYFLPSEISCCVCNSADTFQKCTASTGCGDGFSQKLFIQNLDCLSIVSQQNCPTWHGIEIVSASVDLSYTESISGDCCCLYLPGTGGCDEPCPESGSGSIVTDFVSSSITYGINFFEVSGTETRVETTDCQDGNPGTTYITKNFLFTIPDFNFCCSTTPGICSDSKFGISSIPEDVIVYGDAGNVSAIGECLAEKGYSCAGGYEDHCAQGVSGNLYTPDISASLLVIIKNMQGQTITTKQIYPEKIECPVANYLSCCAYNCLVGNYSYQYTLTGQIILRIGNE